MTKFDLKGVAKVTSKGHDYYYYAWSGGPRLKGKPGTPEFVASYNHAIASLKATDTDRFRSVVVQYKATEFKELADSTKRNWASWLDRIDEYFGNLHTAQFDRRCRRATNHFEEIATPHQPEGCPLTNV